MSKGIIESKENEVDLSAAFKLLSTEAREFSLHARVPVLETPPTGLEFLREWVSYNRPVVIKNAFDHWPAMEKWSLDYLKDKLKDHPVSVAVTPTGYADAVYKDKFLLPEERTMKFDEVVDILEDDDPMRLGIFYIQKQCSNLMKELAVLLPDVDEEIDFGSEAFGVAPDAINFWMGDKRAVTSMHKDNYENLYCVIRGEKTFTLIAPTDRPFVPYRHYPLARWRENSANDQFEIVDEEGSVPWVAVDPIHPDLKEFPEFGDAKTITVRVGAGEMLYLPSLWFHHVQQTQGCIAVNYWYDMKYDLKFNYYQFLESLLPRS